MTKFTTSTNSPIRGRNILYTVHPVHIHVVCFEMITLDLFSNVSIHDDSSDHQTFCNFANFARFSHYLHVLQILQFFWSKKNKYRVEGFVSYCEFRCDILMEKT